MSWTLSTGVVDKLGAETVINNLTIEGDMGLDSAVYDQLQAAKRTALELLKTVPGPNVSVNLSGHANGTGCLGKACWSDDFISITVSQHCASEGA